MNGDDETRGPGTFEQLGERLGAATGNAFGRGADLAAGTMGLMLGAAMDTLGGWWQSMDVDRATQSFEPNDRSCRDHFESQSGMGSRDYDQVRPLYQFGHMAGQNPDYQGRQFTDVEPDLRRAWEAQPGQWGQEWPDVRGFVGFGYSQTQPPRDV